jgi:autotransporter translocation and assembly factor TamB
VGVGKYVRENVYLEVEGGAGENSGKVSVEVDLTPSISVETEARQNAESAVRLNYKYDY